MTRFRFLTLFDQLKAKKGKMTFINLLEVERGVVGEMDLKVVDRNHEPIEGATCRVLNATFPTTNVLSFDGVDDYVGVDNSILALISGLSEFSIEFWFYTGITGVSPVIWDCSRAGQFDNWVQHLANKGLRFGLRNNALARTFIDTSTNAFTENQWNHFAGTWDGTTMKIYVNGVEKATGSFSGTLGNTFNNMVFARKAGSTNWWSGLLSDFRFWNTGRSQPEIADNSDTRLVGTETGLLEYFKIDEGIGTSISGKETTGTIFGATWTEADENFPIPGEEIAGYDPTPYDNQTTNANGLTTLNYQINNIHGLEVTLPGKRRFIMPFQRTTRGLLDWQVMLSDYLATFATDRGNILINSEPENNDANFLIE